MSAEVQYIDDGWLKNLMCGGNIVSYGRGVCRWPAGFASQSWRLRRKPRPPCETSRRQPGSLLQSRCEAGASIVGVAFQGAASAASWLPHSSLYKQLPPCCRILAGSHAHPTHVIRFSLTLFPASQCCPLFQALSRFSRSGKPQPLHGQLCSDDAPAISSFTNDLGLGIAAPLSSAWQGCCGSSSCFFSY